MVQPEELRSGSGLKHGFRVHARRAADEDRVAHDFRATAASHQVIRRDRADAANVSYRFGRHQRDNARDTTK